MSSSNKILYLIVLLIIICFSNVGISQDFNHPYPRIAEFTWGGGRPEWYAKSDLLVIGHGLAEKNAHEIKQLNPNVILQGTSDWNKGNPLGSAPSAWMARNSVGEFFKVWGSRTLLDFTAYCPLVDGYKVNTKIPQVVSNTLKANPLLDGYGTDGLWGEITKGTWLTNGDIDLDRNGINDYLEHGKDWIAKAWSNGIDSLLSDYRDLIGSDKIFIVNSGGFHTWGWEYSNGMILERSWAVKYNYESFLNIYFKFMERGRQPHTLLLDGHSSYTNISTIDPFMKMRFLLCTTLLGDGYFDYSDTAHEHHYVQDFDEYHVRLGFPKINAQRIEGGVWVRFFDNGVSIVNASGKTVTVTDSDLRDLNGYDGPYYRFLGGQNPDFNNGQRFESMEFWGATNSSISSGHRMGDAIILLTTSTTVIAEIVIDNIASGTLEGNQAADLSGSWTPGIEENAEKPASWHVGPHWIDDRYSSNPYHLSFSGNGSNSARFTPKIGVAGVYKVYEWHGNCVSGQASNVPYKIVHGSGEKTGTINQSQNYSQWNLLGTYYFSKGTSGYVEITNKANGSVIADAFKFVHLADSVLPNSPSDLKSESRTESSILLSWNAPAAANDNDIASLYNIHRNNAYIASVSNTTYEDNGLTENTSYRYDVYSVDDAGNISELPSSGEFYTSADLTPPTIANINPMSNDLIGLIFSEPVDNTSARNINNYAINNGIIISQVIIVDDITIRLSTSYHIVGQDYQLTINNITDRASIPNAIAVNTTISYVGVCMNISISISADNAYELYVNGNFIGSDDSWESAENYSVQSVEGKNVIAIKGIDAGGEAGIVAEINYNGRLYKTDDSWRVSLVSVSGWERTNFEDINWLKATAYGEHGDAMPWAPFFNVDGISTDNNVNWIWSFDNVNHDTVFFRFSIDEGGDQTAPDPPVGLTIPSP